MKEKKIKNLRKLTYFETGGGLICLSSKSNKTWDGSLTIDGSYWQLLSFLDGKKESILKFTFNSEDYWILNSENKGFIILDNDIGQLIILEIYYIENDNIIWNDIEFEINAQNFSSVNLKSCLIYDSCLSLKQLPRTKGLHKVNSDYFNCFLTGISYEKSYFVTIKNKIVHLEGLVLFPVVVSL